MAVWCGLSVYAKQKFRVTVKRTRKGYCKQYLSFYWKEMEKIYDLHICKGYDKVLHKQSKCGADLAILAKKLITKRKCWY